MVWKRAGVTLAVLLLMPMGCGPLGPGAVQPQAVGKEVLLDSGIGFEVPNAYHETPAGNGRTFRMRGASKPSYETIVVQRREMGSPTLLDDALGQALMRLEAQDNFDLLDVQLRFVGPHLALTYAADFDLLEVPRRQWGVLIGTDAGLLAIFMTSPKETFHEASEDYMSLLHSLHAVAAPATPSDGHL
jgi:hypothetical protein